MMDGASAPRYARSMAFFTLACFALPLILAIALSYNSAWGALRHSALNPMLPVALFIVLAAADFTGIAATGSGELGGHLVPKPPTFALLVGKYVLMLLALLGGVAFGLNARSRRYAVVPRQPVDMRGFLLAVYIVILCAWAFSLAAYSTNFFSFTASVIARLNSANDPVVYVTSILLLPGLCYALPKQSYKVAVPLVLATIIMVFFSGARARLLYAAVPFLFYLVVVRRWRVPRGWFVYGAIVFGLIAIVAVNARTIVAYGREATVERLFNVSDVLKSGDIAVAEANIYLSKIDSSRVNRYPGEGLVSLVTAPLPRSILPSKPISGSVQFTMAFDPERWRTNESALVIGAINEIEYDYPYPVAVALVALFGAAWGAAMVTAMRSRSIHGFAWQVALYIFIFNFFRNDLFIAGGALWVFGLYWLVVEGYRQMKLSAHQGGRAATAVHG